jgi:hypothetical protein
MTIRIALSIMLMQSGIAYVLDVKGAFLYGELEDGKKIYIEISLRFEKFYSSNTVLLLKKSFYEIKQAAMAS